MSHTMELTNRHVPEKFLADELQNERSENLVLPVLRGLAENTGMHGLPNITRTKSALRKSFWAIVLLAAIGKTRTAN